MKNALYRQIFPEYNNIDTVKKIVTSADEDF